MFRDLCTVYFTAFASKDIDHLSDLYADNVALRDWEISVKGKNEVLDANRNIFAAIENLKVDIVEVHEAGNVCACEIIIHINDDKILVTDIIGFSADGKIEFIRAYKGWSDCRRQNGY